MPDHPDAPDDQTLPAPNDDAGTPSNDAPKFGEPGGEPPGELDQGPLVA